MAIHYDPPAAAAVRELLEDASRRPLAERVVSALQGLNAEPGGERFRRRAYAPAVDWGFLVRRGNDEVLILWDWDAESGSPRVRYVGPDL